MPLCSLGSSPKLGAPSTYWVTAADIQSWLPSDQYSRLAPWFWNLAEHLVAIPTLCASDPPQPPAITDADILLASSNPISAIGLANRLSQFADWWVWSQQCQCNGAGTCGGTTIDMQLGTNLLWCSGGGGGYVFPGPPQTPNCAASTGNYPFPSGCSGPLDFVLWMMPRTAVQPGPFNYNMYDCTTNFSSGAIKGGQMFAGTWTGHTGPPGCPGFHLLWGINDSGARPHWQLDIMPTTGGPTPAPPPSITTITVAPYPTPPCGTTADLCNIVWNQKSYLTQIFNTTQTNTTNILLDMPAKEYALGSSHTLTGQGEQAVATGTLGVLLNATVVPAWQQSEATEPVSYYDIGWIALGTPDGVYPKRWIRFNGEILIPDFPEFTRFAYNCGDGVTLMATELVPVT